MLQTFRFMQEIKREISKKNNDRKLKRGCRLKMINVIDNIEFIR